MKNMVLSSKHQVVIPLSVRKKLGLHSGDRLVIARVTDKEVVLQKEPTYYDFLGVAKYQATDPVTRLRKLRDTWRS